MDQPLKLIFDTTVQDRNSDSWVIGVMALVSLIPLGFGILAIVMRIRRRRNPAPRLEGMPETSLRTFVLIVAITLGIGIAFATAMASSARKAYAVHRQIRDKDYALREGTITAYVLTGTEAGYAMDWLTLDGGTSFEISCSATGLYRSKGPGYCLPIHAGDRIRIAYVATKEGDPRSEPLLIWKLP